MRFVIPVPSSPGRVRRFHPIRLLVVLHVAITESHVAAPVVAIGDVVVFIVKCDFSLLEWVLRVVADGNHLAGHEDLTFPRWTIRRGPFGQRAYGATEAEGHVEGPRRSTKIIAIARAERAGPKKAFFHRRTQEDLCLPSGLFKHGGVPGQPSCGSPRLPKGILFVVLQIHAESDRLLSQIAFASR